jgi:hypothetical protein
MKLKKQPLSVRRGAVFIAFSTKFFAENMVKLPMAK